MLNVEFFIMLTSTKEIVSVNAEYLILSFLMMLTSSKKIVSMNAEC